MQIFKYPIKYPNAINTLDMPEGAKALSFQNQNDVLCLWALVDEKKPLVKTAFFCVGTGIFFDGVENFEYIGTAQDGSFVWHLFKQLEP